MAKSTQQKTYQEMSDELAELLAWFESEAVSLDDAIPKYEHALKLLQQMEKYLKSAENRVKKIKVTAA